MEQNEQLVPAENQNEITAAEPVQWPAEGVEVPTPISEPTAETDIPVEPVTVPPAEPVTVPPAEPVTVPPVEPVAIPVTAAPAEPITPKQTKKLPAGKLMVIIGSVLIVALVACLIAYFTVIKPNGIYDDAVAALDSGDFAECQRLIDTIPNHKKVPELKADLTLAMAESYLESGNLAECQRLIDTIPNHKKVPELKTDLTLAMAESYLESGDLDMAESLLVTMHGNQKAQTLREDITYRRAEDQVNRGNYAEAQLLLDKIPNHEDPKQLSEKISYENALACLEKGDYETAYEMFNALGDYSDAAKQKETVYYEALAFKSLFVIQETLKNPASMHITKVTFYEHATEKGELNAIFEFNATNSYGGSLGAYGYDITLYDDSEDSGMISHSAYVDPDDYYDLLLGLIVDTIKEEKVHPTTVDVARMNRLLAGNATFKIDLPFRSGAEVEN